MIWELESPPVEAAPGAAELQPLAGIAWGRPRFIGVAIDLGELPLQGVAVDCGIVPRFRDPFTTYRIQLPDSAVLLTVYESNFDGALLRQGKLHEPLRDWILHRYGIHRYSDPQWKIAPPRDAEASTGAGTPAR